MSDPAEVEKSAVQTSAPQSKWPLWKKLTIAGVTIAVVVGLSVGLGVGLTRNKGDNGDDGPSSSEPGDELQQPPTARPNIWRPKVGDSYQIVLHDPIDENVDIHPDVAVWDLDLYENDAATFKKLQDAGKKVICYFSAGTWEKYRGDAKDFKKEDLGKTLPEWTDERWLKLSSDSVRSIMSKRIELAASKGCDAIDPDNVDGFLNKNGLGLTAQDSIDYMSFLQKEATKWNMGIGLKNAPDIVEDVLKFVDFAVVEQCVGEEKDCKSFSPFIDAGKPVFQIEYPDGAPKISEKDFKTICSRTGDSEGSTNFTTVLKTMELDGFVRYCDGSEFTTKLKAAN